MLAAVAEPFTEPRRRAGPCASWSVPEQGEIAEQVNFGRVAVWTGKPLKAWTSAAFEDGKLFDDGLGTRTWRRLVRNGIPRTLECGRGTGE